LCWSATSAPSTVKPAIPSGVAPLRAGQGYSFLLRRLHSLSGIVPIGAFLVGTISQWWGVSAAFFWNGALGLAALAGIMLWWRLRHA